MIELQCNVPRTYKICKFARHTKLSAIIWNASIFTHFSYIRFSKIGANSANVFRIIKQQFMRDEDSNGKHEPGIFHLQCDPMCQSSRSWNAHRNRCKQADEQQLLSSFSQQSPSSFSERRPSSGSLTLMNSFCSSRCSSTQTNPHLTVFQYLVGSNGSLRSTATCCPQVVSCVMAIVVYGVYVARRPWKVKNEVSSV